ncbi:MAG: phosphate ABC transporter substrate-binding protein [Alphaproteobacteria bacterium]|nr:phosphate ABC transporter substrate-binding protein [Alphaproteobacteria bacterium]
MNKKIFLFVTLLICLNSNIYANNIRISGSSTVYPFMSFITEEYAARYKQRAPIIEAAGTGGGFKVFCSGVGENAADIANASRVMTEKEVDNCKKNKVNNIAHLKIGYDGIVLVNMSSAHHFNLSEKELFFALAEFVPKDGQIIKNPYKKWQEINPNLPNTNIIIYGPPPTSGTRDVFVENIIYKNCVHNQIFKDNFANITERHKYCNNIREDGAYIEMGENDNLIIHKLLKNHNALGIVGYSFLDNNRDFLTGAKINGIEASYENIKTQRYALSRPLFIYIKEDNYQNKDNLKNFVKHIVSSDLIGEDGYLVYRGLIPLSKTEFRNNKKIAYDSLRKF